MSKIEKGGTFRGRACGQVVLGNSAKKGTPQIQFYFGITKGPHEGERVRWTGYFGEKSATRTIESLQHCGWMGEDLAEFQDGELHGLDRNEVELVVEMELWTVQVEDEQGNVHEDERSAPRVQWVNAGTGFLNIENAMKPEEAASFGDKMRALVLKAKQKKGLPPAEDPASFNYGANAPPQAAAGGRKF